MSEIGRKLLNRSLERKVVNLFKIYFEFKWLFQRKVDVKFSYCGTLPISSDDAKALELAKTPTRKRTNRHLTPTGDQSEKIPEKESRLYDIVHEEIENKKEVITLNGAAMIREKLNISQKGTLLKFRSLAILFVKN